MIIFTRVLRITYISVHVHMNVQLSQIETCVLLLLQVTTTAGTTDPKTNPS